LALKDFRAQLGGPVVSGEHFQARKRTSLSRKGDLAIAVVPGLEEGPRSFLV